MTSLAMNSGYRFESMQSSGMRQVGELNFSINGFFAPLDKTLFNVFSGLRGLGVPYPLAGVKVG
jgi:hypothetical protein